MDFTQGQDNIDLREIDANQKLRGDQAFTLTDDALIVGEVGFHFDSSAGRTVINANVDNDSESELTIFLFGEYNLSGDDFIL